MRMPAILFALYLSLTLVTAVPAQKSPQSSRTPDGSRLYYYAAPRSTLETEVHAIPPDDLARFDRLRTLFAAEGCTGDQLKIQTVADRHESGLANLICVWPGNSSTTVVVLAEYQHEGKGQSAIENWSGAVLLPYLYLAMQARSRENNWVFVESAGKSGAAAYVRSLSREQKKQIRAMVAVNSLGVSPALRYYSPDPEEIYVSPSVGHLQMALALTTLSDVGVPRPEVASQSRWLPFDDTQPFRYSHVPCIQIDSVAEKDAGIPGSIHDTVAAVNGNAYFMNYRAIAVFLVGLDALAAKLQGDDPIWHGEGGQFHLDLNDLPPTH
jgi:hypothetical protein